MGFVELFLIAVGLSMDAFAVSVCKGLAMRRIRPRSAAIVGLWFGGFQAGMPLLGWLLGSRFAGSIEKIDHWVAFALLTLIGANMIRESLSRGEDENSAAASLSFRAMLPAAVATSIDALAVGVTFAFLQVRPLSAAGFIGITTFLLSAAGVYVSSAFGTRYKARAELAGGAILILLGLKILLEHLDILRF